MLVRVCSLADAWPTLCPQGGLPRYRLESHLCKLPAGSTRVHESQSLAVGIAVLCWDTQESPLLLAQWVLLFQPGWGWLML